MSWKPERARVLSNSQPIPPAPTISTFAPWNPETKTFKKRWIDWEKERESSISELYLNGGLLLLLIHRRRKWQDGAIRYATEICQIRKMKAFQGVMFSNRKRDWRFLGFMWVDSGGRRDCSDGKQRDSLSLGGLFCKFYLSSFVSSVY